jgi:hypothetical protein
VPRLSRIAAVGLVPLALAVPLGCGSSSKKDESGTTKTTRTAPGAETPPPPLPANDGQAYAEIQRDSGVLRAAAVPVAYGTASRIVVADRLNAAARTLTGVKPRNPLLVRLRRQTLAALGKAGSRAGLDETKAKGIARKAIAEADRIDAGLRRYAALHPAANG